MKTLSLHKLGKHLWQILHKITVMGFLRNVFPELINVAAGQRMKMELLKGAQMERSCMKPRCLCDAFAVAHFSTAKHFSVLHNLSKGDIAAPKWTPCLCYPLYYAGISTLVSLTAASGALQRKEPTKLFSDSFPVHHPFLFLLDAQMWSAAWMNTISDACSDTETMWWCTSWLHVCHVAVIYTNLWAWWQVTWWYVKHWEVLVKISWTTSPCFHLSLLP